jgi:hypothetical protein
MVIMCHSPAQFEFGIFVDQKKEIFVTGQNKENLNRVFSRYTGTSRETIEQNKSQFGHRMPQINNCQ